MKIINFKVSHKQAQAWLKLHPEEKQTEFILFGGGSNGGKTFLGCQWLLYMARMYPGTRYFIGREELKRLRESTLETFFKLCQMYDVKPKIDFTYNGQDHFIEFLNGSRIDLLDLKYLPSDPLYERYGSIEYTSGWIEEAGEVHFSAYDVLKARINRFFNDKYNILGKMLITCNPKKNWLYHEYYIPWGNGTLPGNKCFIQSLYNDNPFRERGSEDKLNQLTDRVTKERLLYGNWNYTDEPDQLITYQMLEEARKVKPEYGNKKLGVDVARFGDDETVFITIQGNELIGIQEHRNLSIDRTSAIISNILHEQNINADNCGVDGVGLGAGVVDILKNSGFNVIDIIGGASPTWQAAGHKFLNLRAQIWWQAKEAIGNKEVCLKNAPGKLFDDLTMPRYEIRGDKTIVIESKESIKKRTGRSPNYGDAFVYALFVDKISEKQIARVEFF